MKKHTTYFNTASQLYGVLTPNGFDALGEGFTTQEQAQREAEKCDADPSRVRLLRVMKLATFIINDNEGGYVTAVGIYDPLNNWNGFACPFFDKETAQRLCATFSPNGAKGDGLQVVFREDLDQVQQIEDGDAEGCETLISHGVTYYAVGDSWTWEVIPSI